MAERIHNPVEDGGDSPDQIAKRAGAVAGELRNRYYAVLAHLHKSIKESGVPGYIGEDAVRQLKVDLENDWHAVEVLVTNNAGHNPEDLIAPLTRYRTNLRDYAQSMNELGIPFSSSEQYSTKW